MTPAQKAAITRKANKVRDERLAVCIRDNAEERRQFNLVVGRGVIITLVTAFGPYKVDYVDGEWWYHCHRIIDGVVDAGSFSRSFCGCNDGTWADLMAQAGIERIGVNRRG